MRKTVGHSLPRNGTTSSYPLLGQDPIRSVTLRFGFATKKACIRAVCRNEAVRGVSTNTPGARPPALSAAFFPDRVRVGKPDDARNRSCDLPRFSFPLTKTLSAIKGRRRKRRRTATEANAEHKQIPKFECSAVWSDGRRQKFAARTFGIAPFNPKRASSKRICSFSTKIVTGIPGGVTDQNILRGTIFVWMHFFLASRANIRILHNANSRQTRQEEREGRCMEDATIN